MWDDPLSFKPERFIGTKIDYKGQHYELIPFGAGRRMCAGMPLAHRVLHLILGSLLHKFDWELDGNVTRETIDMKDRLGITIRKNEALLVVKNVMYRLREGERESHFIERQLLAIHYLVLNSLTPVTNNPPSPKNKCTYLRKLKHYLVQGLSV